METKNKKEEKIQVIKPRIPNELVYEIIDGKPVYYKGYKEVINQEKQIEEIMGSSDIQVIIISSILKYLYKNIKDNKYFVGTNEAGLHLENKNNLAGDIIIFNREDLKNRKISGKYLDIPPKIIIEVDTKADLSNFDNIMDYYQVKTNKLFNFGVEKVFWVLTKNKQIIEAIPNENWLVKEWNKEIQLFDDLQFSIDQLLKDDDIYDMIYQ